MYDEIIAELLILTPPEDIEQLFTKDYGFYIRTKNNREILLFELVEVLTNSEFKDICGKIATKLSLKGVHGGNCNVSSCQKPNALYFNKSTKAYYCKECAEEINWVGGRADVMKLYGVPLLCEYVPLDKPVTPAICEVSEWHLPSN